MSATEQDDPRARRVRVTAPRPGEPLHPGVSGTTAREAEAAGRVLVRSLMRSQLRIAVLSALAFALTLTAIALVAALPGLQSTIVGGVPASWLVLGFAAYPPLVAVAAIATLAAGRTESQYRALTRTDDEAPPARGGRA